MTKPTIIEKMTIMVNNTTIRIQNWIIGVQTRRDEKRKKKEEEKNKENTESKQ